LTKQPGITGGFWFYLRVAMEFLVGLIALMGVYFWINGAEARAVNMAILALLISLTGVRLLVFYFDQFSATTLAMIQLIVLLIILAYREWYLEEQTGEGFSSVF
jgi:hypothetical protein